MFILLLIFLFFAFALGSVIGSFLNVVIMRGAKDESLQGRSHCDHCDKMLGARELIPLVSFVYQKGRCRNCGIVLSVQYPLIELATGIVFAGVIYYTLLHAIILWDMALVMTLIILLASASAMIVIVAADLKYHIIPNGATLLLFLLGIAAALGRSGLICFSAETICTAVSFNGIALDITASIAFILFFFAIWFLSRGRAMGFGDVKLIGATSLLLGFPLSLVAFLFSFWLGGLWGIFLLLTRMRGMKSQIAFGPFIIAGAVLAYFFGAQFLAVSGFSYVGYLF